MYTQCPQCLTVYRINAGSLSAGHGTFRCGQCASLFDGLPSLSESLPDDLMLELPRANAGLEPPVLSVPALRPMFEQQPTLFDLPVMHSPEPDEPFISGFPVAAPTNEPLQRERAVFSSQEISRNVNRRSADLPSFATSRADKSKSAGSVRKPEATIWKWLAACLALVLIGQIIYVERDQWLTDSRIRPALDQLAAKINMSLPLRSDVHSLHLLTRTVTPHPNAKNALRISASLRNEAPFVQTFPVVEVRFFDIDHKVIAMRRFRPHEYLADAASAIRGFASGAIVPLVFEVLDPGSEAVNFEFEFLSR
jgi:predicted Zn finger-like uncharacterized protein